MGRRPCDQACPGGLELTNVAGKQSKSLLPKGFLPTPRQADSKTKLDVRQAPTGLCEFQGESVRCADGIQGTLMAFEMSYDAIL